MSATRRARCASQTVIAAALVAAMLAATPPAHAAWRQTAFLIGGYGTLGMPRDARRLVLVDRAGIDWVNLYDQRTPGDAAGLVAMLDSLRVHRTGFRLRAILTLGVVGDPSRWVFQNRRGAASRAAIDRLLDPASGLTSPSTLGWSVWDEPLDSTSFSAIGEVSRAIQDHPHARDALPFTNLAHARVGDGPRSRPGDPWYEQYGPGAGRTQESGYRAYLRDYLREFRGRGAPLLSFDDYPFMDPAHPGRDYFLNLRLVREAAATGGAGGRPIPFWVVVQLSPYAKPGAAFPSAFTFTHTRWQVWDALAYGAKGIAYWSLTPAWNRYETWQAGLIDTAGADTADARGRYSRVRALNRELHALGPTLMRLDPVAVAHARTLADEGLESERLGAASPMRRVIRAFGSGADSALVGWLRDRARGDDYLLVVNKALHASQSFTLTLARRAAAIERISRVTGKPVRVATATASLRVKALAPGQGELFHLARK